MHIPQEILEFGRLGLVFFHLLACCVAIGLVLKSDFTLVRSLLKPDAAADRAHMGEMDALQATVTRALAALWATGAAIVALDAVTTGGWQYFANPKIQAKIVMVSLLTLNGMVLHNLVLPSMKRVGSILNLSFSQTVLATFAGTVSGVSWLYAALLGVGRPLSWKYSLVELMAAYPALVAGGFLSMMALIALCKLRPATATAASLALEPVARLSACVDPRHRRSSANGAKARGRPRRLLADRPGGRA
ncbi:hypothetical protein [Ramlibacter montanisoli]|uniref:DUF2214 family protein n=1 Tax=Ramlibacter montanisoli TaxID=2732512 RepID=A0A849KL63_9BURK|nr:hypothetical protein [Ramlibacter montanisoli]NNU44683.1 hypothetical protein [Ramlibacter montanisoli]